MKAAKKPYWGMNTEELATATREFDHELSPDEFRSLGPEKQAIWDRLQGRGTEVRRVRGIRDVQDVRQTIKNAGKKLKQGLKSLVGRDPLDILKDFKLLPLGYDPFDPRREMNLVEQINQSATLLVACAAVERLLEKHPSQEGYVIARPTAKGYDVWAVDVSVAAEVFAATSPGSNQKIQKDLSTVLRNKEPFVRDPPQHRYIFFAARSPKGFPAWLDGPHDDSILGKVWYLTEHERRSVTVVPLQPELVFLSSQGLGTKSGRHGQRLNEGK